MSVRVNKVALPTAPCRTPEKLRCNHGDHQACAICHRCVKRPRFWDPDGWHFKTDPNDSGDCGWHPIGENCLRRHPEFRVVMQETTTP